MAWGGRHQGTSCWGPATPHPRLSQDATGQAWGWPGGAWQGDWRPSPGPPVAASLQTNEEAPLPPGFPGSSGGRGAAPVGFPVAGGQDAAAGPPRACLPALEWPRGTSCFCRAWGGRVPSPGRWGLAGSAVQGPTGGGGRVLPATASARTEGRAFPPAGSWKPPSPPATWWHFRVTGKPCSAEALFPGGGRL